jgi:hypothetical protein
VAFAIVLEGSGPVLEELSLPAVEQVRGDLELVTEVGNRLLLQEMEPEDGHLIGGRVVLALLAHGKYLRREFGR